MHRPAYITAFIALAYIASAPQGALGCVADVFTLDRLATESAYIVTATVSEVRSYWTPDHMRIETAITLTGVERITRDGAVAEPDITYTVVGGTVGDSTLRVCCAPELHVGDHWVLFLQREYRHYPVLGMERGMFRIEQPAEGGAARVLTSGGDPVVAIADDGAVTVTSAARAQEHNAPQARRPRSVRGAVSAVRVIDRPEAPIADHAPPVDGLTLEDFLAQVRSRLPEDLGRVGGGRGADVDIELSRMNPGLTPVKLRSVIHHEENPGVAK